MQKKPTSSFAKFLIWKYKHTSERQFINILSAVVGFIAGLAAIFLKNFTYFIKVLLEGRYIGSVHKLFYFAFPVIGLLIVILIKKYVIKKKMGHGIPATLYSISKLKSIMPSRQMWAYLITGPFTVGFGGSVGLEGPTVVTGAAIGSNFGRFFHMNQATRTLLVGAAAAGAISSIFKAPIAGIVFAVEIFSLDLTLFSMVPLLIAATVAVLTSYFFFGDDVLFHYPTQNGAFDFTDALFYSLLGVFTAMVSLYFNKVYFAIGKFFERFDGVYKRLIIGGLLIGVIVFLVPPLYGEGYETVNQLLKGNIQAIVSTNYLNIIIKNEWLIIAFLMGLVIFKVIAMSITFGAGGVGGIFAPTLFTGSVAGYVFAYFTNSLGVLNHQFSTSNFALVGMAGLMAGVMQAPLTAIFLIAEISNGYSLLVPIMITTSISFVIVRHYIPHNIYASQLAKQGKLITHDKDKKVLMLMELDKVIETNFIILNPEMDLGEIVNSAVRKSSRNHFPVVNDEHEFLGIITLDDIRGIMFDTKMYTKLKAASLLQTCPEIINYDTDSMEEVMEKFKVSSAWNLPVIKDGKYFGFISKSRLLSAYRRKLISVTA